MSVFPPPPAATLEANPNFENLYKYLITHVLSHDGSSLRLAEEYNTTYNNLEKAREIAVRDKIILRALTEIAAKPDDAEPTTQPSLNPTTLENAKLGNAPGLPDVLMDLTYNIACYLSSSLDLAVNDQLPADTDELMADEVAKFREHLPEICRALSQQLVNTEAALSGVAVELSNTVTPRLPDTAKRLSTRKHRQTEPQRLSQLLDAQEKSTQNLLNSVLPTALATTSSSLSSMLTSHTSHLQALIRELELTTYGTTSRHLSSRAAYLSTVSRGIELKARILHLEREKAIYGDRALMNQLDEENDRLAVEERKLERQEKQLEALLNEYSEAGQGVVGRVGVAAKEESSGEDVFRVLGERYAEVEQEIEVVKKDIERLETRVWRGR